MKNMTLEQQTKMFSTAANGDFAASLMMAGIRTTPAQITQMEAQAQAQITQYQQSQGVSADV